MCINMSIWHSHVINDTIYTATIYLAHVLLLILLLTH